MRAANLTWHTAVCAVALMTASTAHAQTVQKCMHRDGEVRYQSEPCGAGERVLGTWDATPDPEPPPAIHRQYSTSSTTRYRRPRRTRVAQYRNDVAIGDSCSAARAYRDTEERRAGLARNYDLLSALQQRVFEACR